MRRDWFSFLSCPDCLGVGLSVGEILRCPSCDRVFVEEDGILDLMPSVPAPEPKLYSNPAFKAMRAVLHKKHSEYYKSGSVTRLLEDAMKRGLMSMVSFKTDLTVDFGCGTGSGFDMFGDKSNILGIDIDMRLLRCCRLEHTESSLVCCNMVRPPFRDGSFSSIMTMGTLEHMFDLEIVVANLERILVPGGLLYVMIPTEGGFSWALARLLFTAGSLKEYGISRRDYLDALRVEHCNTVFSVDNALRKYFIVEMERFWPLRIGGAHFNLSRLYRLRKP